MDNRLIPVRGVAPAVTSTSPAPPPDPRRTAVPGPDPRSATVLPGAEPFDFPGGDGPDGRTGVLLVHGFTGTPMSMRPWGEHLAAAGFAGRCPLLPGHGTRGQDCNLVTEQDWTTAVGAAFDELSR